MNFDFDDTETRKHLAEGSFGLEKESLRVTPDGFLAQTKHPFGNDARMDRDFCENQTELITGVSPAPEAARAELAALHAKAVRTLARLDSGRELMWPFSNPPYVLGENDVPIAEYHGELQGKSLYRRYLAEKYGRKKMLFSGIHFNFSFSEALLDAGFRRRGGDSAREFRDAVYLSLAARVAEYAWLVVYLTAASSVADASFFDEKDLGRTLAGRFASPRCSEIGYWNDFVPLLQYDSLNAYADGIAGYVEQGQLRAASELYYPVRLKPRGENTLERLRERGVDHIELRMLDLDPFEPAGIGEPDVRFLHLFLLYLASLPPKEFLPFEQILAVKNEKRAARFDDSEILIETGWNASLPVREAAARALDEIELFARRLGNADFVDAARIQRRKILRPEDRPAVRVRERFGRDYVKLGLELAERHAAAILGEDGARERAENPPSGNV